ncbi:MAG: glycosyltransferase [Hyphomicrobiales bacterium]|nr:glycosyltransferase [Hyphomicrobiales bacterium]
MSDELQPSPLRIVSIAHTCVSRAAGRLRYHPLAARTDLEVHLVAPARWYQFGRSEEADPPNDPGIALHILPIWLARGGPLSWYLHVYPGLRRLMRQVRPQVIHLWEEPWSLVALHASRMKGDAALVLEVDQNILKRLPPPFEAIRKSVLRRTDHVLARSADAAAVVRARGYRGPIDYIGYGVDQDTFRPASAALSPASTTIAATTPTLQLGYVGRLVADKGLDDALDAIARARAAVRLAIMGEGPHAPALRARVRQLGLDNKVTFQGWGAPADVAQFMQRVDAIILLTRATRVTREQFGRVIIEAQSCGVPVIGAATGAIADVIGAGGWVVPERDPQALAALFDRIAGDPAERHRRGRAGLTNVARRFTYAAVARDLADAWFTAAARVASRRSDPSGRNAQAAPRLPQAGRAHS